MKIVCYFINYNDSFYIPFIAKHYWKFCDQIIMYDNYSTDGSVQIAKDKGIEVRTFGRIGVLNDQHYLDVKNECWKEQIGKGINYVIVVDADEFVFIDDLKENGGTAPIVSGFNMISNHLPVDEITEINTGSESESYSKQAIFNPDLITNINYVHGCHKNRMTGHIQRKGHCRLLHYRQIGGVERILKRHSEYRKRMSKFNLDNGMGIHYLHSDEQKIVEWNELLNKSRKLW